MKKREKIVKVRDGIFHIYESLGVYCTLIVGTKRAVLVDTGYGFGDIAGTVRGLTDLPITVINSHGHVDHIQGNKFFDDVRILQEDYKVLRKHSSLFVKLWIYIFFRKKLTVEEKGRVSTYFRKNRKDATFVRDGEILDIGGHELEIVHTPGHTAGSICILDKTARVLLAADTVANQVWLFIKESTRVSEYRKSIAKLIARQNEFDLIVSSHTPACLKPTILEKIQHCAGNLDPAKSTAVNTGLAGRALLYTESLAKVQQKYGYSSLKELLQHAYEIDPEYLAEIDFVSIAYSRQKL